MIDIGTTSGQGTCSRRDAYMSILPEETTANDNYLHSRRIESIQGRLSSPALVCLVIGAFITVLKGWSIYNLKTNGKVNRIKINKVYLFY